MHTILDHETRAGLIERIAALSVQSKANWGKMDVYQMLKHCTMSEEMFLGKRQYGRLFVGRLFGKMALRQILKDERPLQKNEPTHPELKIRATGDVEREKQQWIGLLQEYKSYDATGFTHPFFGEMDRDQVGHYVYKHVDHHLRQFER